MGLERLVQIELEQQKHDLRDQRDWVPFKEEPMLASGLSSGTPGLSQELAKKLHTADKRLQEMQHGETQAQFRSRLLQAIERERQSIIRAENPGWNAKEEKSDRLRDPQLHFVEDMTNSVEEEELREAVAVFDSKLLKIDVYGRPHTEAEINDKLAAYPSQDWLEDIGQDLAVKLSASTLQSLLTKIPVLAKYLAREKQKGRSAAGALLAAHSGALRAHSHASVATVDQQCPSSICGPSKQRARILQSGSSTSSRQSSFSISGNDTAANSMASPRSSGARARKGKGTHDGHSTAATTSDKFSRGQRDYLREMRLEKQRDELSYALSKALATLRSPETM